MSLIYPAGGGGEVPNIFSAAYGIFGRILARVTSRRGLVGRLAQLCGVSRGDLHQKTANKCCRGVDGVGVILTEDAL